VHVKRCLGKNESTGIRDTRVLDSRETKLWGSVVGTSTSGTSGVCVPPVLGGNINGTSIIEKTVRVDEGLRCLSNRLGSTEGVDGVGEGINSISVVEGLGTKGVVKGLATLKRRAVVDVLVGLDNPNKLLNGVVEVELDLVTVEVIDSEPVFWRTSMRYSWAVRANLRRSSVSR